MPLDRDHLESVLAREVGEYIRTGNPELQSDISATLERLLQIEWGARGLSKYRWFDGLAGGRSTFRVDDGSRLHIQGLMVWSERGAGEQWVELFSADIQVATDSRTLLDYTLRLGQRGEENRRVRYEDLKELSRFLDRPGSWEWGWIFRRESRG